ncbi:lipoyl synthase [Treponema primitia]|uniref:lipoyl synthase n=1 Tax=Treponema primitia TaxID=88058 RepID=UPI0039806E66
MKPDWIRSRIPAGDSSKKVSLILDKHRLHTVCDEAHCPNKGECWGLGTATFMILGDICTRGCRFCAVKTGREGQPPRDAEGAEIAAAVEELGLKYLVLTSVDRDDLPDRGANHFAACIRAVKERLPEVKVEALTPDYTAEEFTPIAAAGLDLAAHNVETVRSLQHIRDSRASFDKSLATLRAAKALGLVTKSSILLGLGEKKQEVLETMDELRAAGVDILVLGQYLRPSEKQIPLVEYITPEQFADYGREGRERGFSAVVSAPLARTSYHALDAWKTSAGETG